LRKQKHIKQQEFIVISEYGYFTGLKYGGEPQWSMKEDDAKPLNHMNKFYTLESICPNKELIFELI